ncbi:MAG: lipid A deacylase LpxR family protein [Gammaproteobacteria bacterium]
MKLSKLFSVFYIFLLCGAFPCIAQVNEPPKDKIASDSSTFTFSLENDLFGDTDQQYTSGIQIGWISADVDYYQQALDLPEWMFKYLPFIPLAGAQKNIGVNIGQKIFTPEDLDSRVVIDDDRPYAGWLYGALSFISKTESRLDTVEFQAGVIGPAALGEEAQNTIHDLRNLNTAKGWDNQLENEPGLAIIYERKWRPWKSENPSGFGYDLITHIGGAIGNVYTYANAGAEARIGWNLPADFGTSLMRPGGNSSAPTTYNDPRLNSQKNFGAHLFTGITGVLKLRDVFLDGNTFRDSHDVNKEYVVGDLVVGASVIIHQIKLSYAQVFRTREFEKQDIKHNFGSVSISITFD